MGVVISADLHLAALEFPLTHARIGYHTIGREGDVSASSSAAGFPAEAAANPLTYDRWQPAALPATWEVDAGDPVEIDYVGIAAHSLRAGLITVWVESSEDGEQWDEAASFVPGDNAQIMFLFEPRTARHWRVRLTGDSPQPVGVIYIGKALAMARPIYGGHGPLTLSRQTVIRPQRSELGQFIGRSIIRGGFETGFAWRHLPAGWYREHFDPFAEAARRFPFFIAWRPATFPNEVGYVWVGEDIRPSNMGVLDLMEVSFRAEGLA